MKRSARSLFFERVSVWLREMGGAKWMYAAGAAYALVMIAFFAWPKKSPSTEMLQPASMEFPKEDKVLNLQPVNGDEEAPSKPEEF